MTAIAIKALGFMHGMCGLALLIMAAKLPGMPGADTIPRARIYYVSGKATFGGLALVACAVAAWERPAIAWLFAALSLLSYAPAPSWAKFVPSSTRSRATVRHKRVRILGISARVIGVVLLAIAGISLDG